MSSNEDQAASAPHEQDQGAQDQNEAPQEAGDVPYHPPGANEGAQYPAARTAISISMASHPGATLRFECHEGVPILGSIERLNLEFDPDVRAQFSHEWGEMVGIALEDTFGVNLTPRQYRLRVINHLMNWIALLLLELGDLFDVEE